MAALQERLRGLVEHARQTGTGRIQTYLPNLLHLRVAPTVAVNFWGSLVDMPVCTSGIHRHFSGFKSTIVHGAIINRLYRVEENPRGAYRRYYVNRLWNADGTSRHTMDRGGNRVTAKQVSETEYRAGDTYSLSVSDYHSNEIVIPTMTIMEIDQASMNDTEPFLVKQGVPFSTKQGLETLHTASADEQATAWARIDSFLALLPA